MKLSHPLVLSLVVTTTAGCSGPVDGDDAFGETTSSSPTSGNGESPTGSGTTTSGDGGGPAGPTSTASSSSAQDANSSTSAGDGGGGNGSGGDASSSGGGAGEGGAGTGGSGACDDGPCDDGDDCTEDDTCEDGVCAGSAVTCGPPPSAVCADPGTLRTFTGPGVCADDECEYAETETPCPSGCAAGACSPTIVTKVSAGENHSCAVTSGGAVKCWGRNDDGELGNDSTTDSFLPVEVVGLSSGVTAVSAGNHHTCAVTAGGGVVCWGSNLSGELGNGTTSDDPVTVPVQVSGLSSGVRAVTAGQATTCAVLTSGAIRCWGYNGYGQLGNGSQTSSSVPVQVTGFASGGVDVSLGFLGACAVNSAGEAKCWGGIGTIQTVPVTVGNVSGALAITTGANHACARTGSFGGTWCWGGNGSGELGNNSTTNSATGVYVVGSSDMSAVSAGFSHNCGIVFGAALCWGANFSGPLGNGTTSDSSVPVGVTGLGSGVVDIEAGYIHTCAVTSAGAAKCWGSNQGGQLGIDTNIEGSLVPVDVQGL